MCVCVCTIEQAKEEDEEEREREWRFISFVLYEDGKRQTRSLSSSLSLLTIVSDLLWYQEGKEREREREANAWRPFLFLFLSKSNKPVGSSSLSSNRHALCATRARLFICIRKKRERAAISFEKFFAFERRRTTRKEEKTEATHQSDRIEWIEDEDELCVHLDDFKREKRSKGHILQIDHWWHEGNVR